VTLADKAPPPPDLASDARVKFLGGDLNAQLQAKELPAANTEAIFHLAAAVSGECERDFVLGMRSNLDATRALLEDARTAGTVPVFVFASSLAVFGAVPGKGLPAHIDDDTLPTPQSSYGIQKFICEQLVADYARKGFIHGRNVRLMTVSVRPGRPNGAASGFLSGMIREPLAGVRAAVPVPAETPVALASPGNTVEGILRAAEATDADWGPLTAINLPSLRTSVGEMAQALERVAGPEAAALLDWTPDPQIQALVSTWPGDIQWTRARALGLRADEDFDSVVRAYIAENPQAVKLATR
jgi:nucleoside-diphosphate-sugar epimerase